MSGAGGGGGAPRSTYDAVRDELVLPAFEARVSRYYAAYLATLLGLPDEEFLQAGGCRHVPLRNLQESTMLLALHR